MPTTPPVSSILTLVLVSHRSSATHRACANRTDPPTLTRGGLDIRTPPRPLAASVARQRETLLDVLRPLVPTDGPYALLDYPAHANVGDSAIWVGTREAFRSLGAGDPAYVCCAATYHAPSLRRRVGSGPIFLHGGGNFGDLYPIHQRLREQVARDFPDRPVVVLPQTIRFDREDGLEAAREALGAHPDLTLLVRDGPSLEIGRERLGLRTLLAPDAATALTPPLLTAPPEREVLWLLRADGEARPEELIPPDGAAAVDWPPDAKRGAARRQRHLTRKVARAPREGLRARRLRRTYDAAARRRLQGGCALLASARTVVTDRLHGHLLCVLLGIPHVLLDNRYGKNRALFDAWTHDVPFARWAERDADAVAAALASLREGPGSRAEGTGAPRGIG